MIMKAYKFELILRQLIYFLRFLKIVICDKENDLQ